jgi:hypothetical protein
MSIERHERGEKRSQTRTPTADERGGEDNVNVKAMRCKKEDKRQHKRCSACANRLFRRDAQHSHALRAMLHVPLLVIASLGPSFSQ